MARKSELSQLRDELQRLKAQLGLDQPEARTGEDRGDYIEHGSEAHAQFLGLVIVDEDDDPTGFTLYQSKETGNTYRLVDEVNVMSHYPGNDPEKAALMVLRQKVGALESGRPEPPDNAPNMWQPVSRYIVPVG